jgi:hypothetical protein
MDQAAYDSDGIYSAGAVQLLCKEVFQVG